MKSILMSIKPQYVVKILNGKKTIEIRKRFPLNYRGWVYIYCTKLQSPYGKVVARFYCGNVEEIKYGLLTKYNSYGVLKIVDKYTTKTLTYRKLRDKSCLGTSEFESYFAKSFFIKTNSIIGYAIYISQLEIFDEPKELNEFYKVGASDYDKGVCEDYGERGHLYTCCFFALTKAPRSWQYIEEIEE